MTNSVPQLAAAVRYAISDPAVPTSFKVFVWVLLVVGFFAAVGWTLMPFAVFGMSGALRRGNRRLATLDVLVRDLTQVNARLDVISGRLRELEQTNAQLDGLNTRMRELIGSNAKLGEIADRLGEINQLTAAVQSIVDRMERVFEVMGKDLPPPPPVV